MKISQITRQIAQFKKREDTKRHGLRRQMLSSNLHPFIVDGNVQQPMKGLFQTRPSQAKTQNPIIIA
jgi:hypothetical protein